MFTNPNVAGAANALSLNNALNVFPATCGPQNAQAKLQRLLNVTTARGATEIQSTLARSLYDDAVEYMSTLDMNRAASYTFGHKNSYGLDGTVTNGVGGGTHGESLAGELWELLLDATLCRFVQHSVLALSKTLHLIRHVLLHGSEGCVTDVNLLYRIENALVPLSNLNTALVEQKMVEQILNNDGKASGVDNDVVLNMEGIGQQLSQFGTKASAAMLKMRGGSVDKGYPVREAAAKLYEVVMDRNRLMQLRNQQQSGNQFAQQSLVPIGSAKQVGYITDDARLRLLQQKMAAEERELKQKEWQEQQRMKQTRSNLAGASAHDGFGGGYAASGGGTVVGAANSLEDMIKSAKYELEQHKNKRKNAISSMKKGYCDDPSARARQLQELEQRHAETDPVFLKKEKALQEALDYLEEMKREQQEKVGDLLEGDLLGDASGGIAPTDGAGGSSGADLLGFDNNPTDVFGGASTPANNVVGGTDDLLGFGGMSYVGNDAAPAGEIFSAPQPSFARSSVPANNVQSNTNPPGMRPSLVTGMGGPTQQPPPIEAPQPPLDEEAEAEQSRKMQMAAGLFAGVVSSEQSAPQKKPIMQSGAASNTSALDDLLSVSGAALAPPSTAAPSSAFNASDLNSLSMPPPPTDEYGMGPMGGATGVGVPQMPVAPPPPPPSGTSSMPASDPFGMGPMGGNSGNGSSALPPPPPMAPPPPPMEPPPPPPPSVPAPAMAPPNAPNNPLGNNPSYEQMQEMIKQQQAQMNQMMQMMSQMQNPSGNGAPGGWPPS
ncbi:hypothetical protein ACHAXT_003889 [Thalassiosira profunda]